MSNKDNYTILADKIKQYLVSEINNHNITIQRLIDAAKLNSFNNTDTWIYSLLLIYEKLDSNRYSNREYNEVDGNDIDTFKLSNLNLKRKENKRL